MTTHSIANETVDHSRQKEAWTLKRVLTNTYLLNAVSLILFFLIWDYVAKERIFHDSLARPLDVLKQIIKLITVKYAGSTLWGHIWASTEDCYLRCYHSSPFRYNVSGSTTYRVRVRSDPRL